jgi:hypothetical protein
MYSRDKIMPIAVACSEYDRDAELRVLWHNILSTPTLLEKLPSNTWQGWKLQDILWSGKINEREPGWEEKLINLWKE